MVILSLSNGPTKKDTSSVHVELRFEVIRLWSPTVTTSHLTSSATFAGSEEKFVKNFLTKAHTIAYVNDKP